MYTCHYFWAFLEKAQIPAYLWSTHYTLRNSGSEQLRSDCRWLAHNNHAYISWQSGTWQLALYSTNDEPSYELELCHNDFTWPVPFLLRMPIFTENLSISLFYFLSFETSLLKTYLFHILWYDMDPDFIFKAYLFG